MDLTPAQIEKLEHYVALLKKWQKTINLVSLKTLEDAWERHILDSVQLLEVLPEKRDLNVLDLGSGAGFPGLVLAILNPEWNVTLVESDQRKCVFLQTVSRETSSPAKVLNQRIEDVESDMIPDVITARALASLDKLLAYAAPYFKKNPDLICVFPKGQFAESEITESQKIYEYQLESKVSNTDTQAQILKISNLSPKI